MVVLNGSSENAQMSFLCRHSSHRQPGLLLSPLATARSPKAAYFPVAQLLGRSQAVAKRVQGQARSDRLHPLQSKHRVLVDMLFYHHTFSVKLFLAFFLQAATKHRLELSLQMPSPKKRILAKILRKLKTVANQKRIRIAKLLKTNHRPKWLVA